MSKSKRGITLKTGNRKTTIPRAEIKAVVRKVFEKVFTRSEVKEIARLAFERGEANRSLLTHPGHFSYQPFDSWWDDIYLFSKTQKRKS